MPRKGKPRARAESPDSFVGKLVEATGLTQDDFAARVGASDRVMVARWVTGANEPSAKYLEKIEKEFPNEWRRLRAGDPAVSDPGSTVAPDNNSGSYAVSDPSIITVVQELEDIEDPRLRRAAARAAGNAIADAVAKASANPSERGAATGKRGAPHS